MICRVFLPILVALAVVPVQAADERKLAIFSKDHPVSLFFRQTEAAAATRRMSYEDWASRFGRLHGVIGKMLDEEIIGRSAGQSYFRRFKAEHPDQAVLLHANPNFRKPEADNRLLHPGHWLYYNGARVLSDVPASGDTAVLEVSDTSIFHLSPYVANRSFPDDVGLCALGADGKPDWSRAEQTKLVAIDAVKGTIKVQRGLYGSTPLAFARGKAYAAAHVAQTWGTINKLWELNMATTAPRDVSGRTGAEVWADELIRLMSPGGEVSFLDGVQFDVPFRRPMAIGGPRRADCDADGKPDDGIVNGQPVFALGEDQFFRRLRAGLPDRIIMADVNDRSQRSLESLNGIETEGWPHLRDPDFKFWSTALNDHAFWEERARSPIFNYGLLKFRDGQVRGASDVPLSAVRLAIAGPLLTGSAVPLGYEPPEGSNGIWDEVVGGDLQRRGWLGRAVGPARHLATESAPLTLKPVARQPAGVSVGGGADRLMARAKISDEEKFTAVLAEFDHAAQGDLVVTLRVKASPLSTYPPDSYRVITVAALPPGQEIGPRSDAPTSPANATAFSATFYLRAVPAGKLNLLVRVEGGEPVELSDVRVYRGPDVMAAEFARGVILANPSAEPYTFELGRLFPRQPLRRLRATTAQDPATNDGSPCGPSVTVPARDALFLLKG